jgi:hypothetical protein
MPASTGLRITARQIMKDKLGLGQVPAEIACDNAKNLNLACQVGSLNNPSCLCVLRRRARVQLHSQPSTLSPHTNHPQSADTQSNKWGMGGEGESEFSPEPTPPTGSVHFAKRREIHQGRLDKFMPRVDGQSVGRPKKLGPRYG